MNIAVRVVAGLVIVLVGGYIAVTSQDRTSTPIDQMPTRPSEVGNVNLPGPPTTAPDSTRLALVQSLNNTMAAGGHTCNTSESYVWSGRTLSPGVRAVKDHVIAQLKSRGWQYEIFDENAQGEMFFVQSPLGNQMIVGGWANTNGNLNLTWCYARPL